MDASFITYDRVRDCIRRRRTVTCTTCRRAPNPWLLLQQLTRCILLPTLRSHTRVVSSTHTESLVVTGHLGGRSRCRIRQWTSSVAILTGTMIDDYGDIYHRIGFVKVVVDVVVDNETFADLIHTGRSPLLLRCETDEDDGCEPFRY